MLKGTGKAYRRARELRRDLSLPEALLWQQLRRRQTGFKWRKQHPAGPYDLDFYCDVAKLCVEIDGRSHESAGRPAHDARRDAWLAEHGIATLRIPAADVLRNMEGVLAWIDIHARKRAPLHRPPDGPPPPAPPGEEF